MNQISQIRWDNFNRINQAKKTIEGDKAYTNYLNAARVYLL